MSKTNKSAAAKFFDTLPSDITKALGPAGVATIISAQHATRANGDLVIVLRRVGVNGAERWVAAPKPGAMWQCEGVKTRVACKW